MSYLILADFALGPNERPEYQYLASCGTNGTDYTREAKHFESVVQALDELKRQDFPGRYPQVKHVSLCRDLPPLVRLSWEQPDGSEMRTPAQIAFDLGFVSALEDQGASDVARAYERNPSHPRRPL